MCLSHRFIWEYKHYKLRRNSLRYIKTKKKKKKNSKNTFIWNKQTKYYVLQIFWVSNILKSSVEPWDSVVTQKANIRQDALIGLLQDGPVKCSCGSQYWEKPVLVNPTWVTRSYPACSECGCEFWWGTDWFLSVVTELWSSLTAMMLPLCPFCVYH